MEKNLEKLKAKTDMQCKILLSNSQVISRFVKCFVDEAKELTLNEIESCICATEVTNPNQENISIHGENTSYIVYRRPFL